MRKSPWEQFLYHPNKPIRKRIYETKYNRATYGAGVHGNSSDTILTSQLEIGFTKPNITGQLTEQESMGTVPIPS